MDSREMEKRASEQLAAYKDMAAGIAGWLLRQVSWQYQDMAKGGDGGSLGFLPKDYDGPARDENGPTCREYNYPEYPDTFFQFVCEGMGWK
jgi:hypothetical protein